MKLAFELTGEHPSLPRAEAEAVAALAGATVEAEATGRVLVADHEGPLDPYTQRLAMTRRIVEVHARTPIDLDAIVEAAADLRLGGRRFEVRCSRLDANIDPERARQVARSLGRALEADGVVDLDDPEVTVRVLLEKDAVIGVQRAQIDRRAFEARHVEERAHFSPISMHPRLARALVNLTRAGPGESVWDPFAGTGGLVLEAALVGCQAIASDLDAAMIEGTRATLSQYGCAAKLVEGDVTDVAGRLGTVAAIVTDPPYGRASSTHREDIGKLYERFFQAARPALAPGGRVVVVLPRAEDIDRANGLFDVVDRHDWYVHGSLTRHIFVLA